MDGPIQTLPNLQDFVPWISWVPWSLGTKHESDFYDRHITRDRESEKNEEGNKAESMERTSLELPHPYQLENQYCEPIVV